MDAWMEGEGVMEGYCWAKHSASSVNPDFVMDGGITAE